MRSSGWLSELGDSARRRDEDDLAHPDLQRTGENSARNRGLVYRYRKLTGGT